MRQFHILNNALLQQEKHRLSRKLSESHPRVRKLDASIKQNTELARGLRVQLEVAKIEVTEAPEGGALVHGRVADKAGRGISGLIVRGETAQGRPSPIFGSVETGSSGYFAMPLEAEVLTKLASQKQRAEVFLTVRTKRDRLLVRDKEALMLEVGAKLVKEFEVERKSLRESKPGKRPGK
jgi:hypothetical protein